ncbi:hypothetical protein [Bacillus sp. ISL-55]|uniref:hypothetical protein n=1 Tax=Bacillus sp. ISL-55 TaxID=2819134 RepID=UPI001BEB21AE|nr:hypothetical protein [Bacillus sp. ISL-55]MBT2691714.1 hypothetical protein [Bacillus sp. ISL-55]
MTKKFPLIFLGFLGFVALLSTFLFFKTILSNLIPELMIAKAIPLAIFSGLSFIALSITLRTNKQTFSGGFRYGNTNDRPKSFKGLY